MEKLKTQLLTSLKMLKKHYFVFVLVCLITMMLGGEFFETAQFIKTKILPNSSESEMSVYTVLQLWGQGDDESSIKTTEDLINQMIAGSKDNKVFGHSDGVFADIVNKVTSGYFLIHLLILLTNLFKSRTVAGIIVIAAAFAMLFCAWTFIQNMCTAVSRRMFLEGRCYEKVSVGRIRFFYRIGKWAHVAWVLFVSFWFQILWGITIIGGIIARYSYYLVPFIIAENPNLTAKQAMRTSRLLMYGHRFEFMLKELMFIPKVVFGFFTGGLSGVFFFNPLRTAFFCECYASVRAEGIRKGIEGTELLTDYALFAKPEKQELDKAYSDILDLPNVEPVERRMNGFTRFCVKWFGLTFWEGKEEREYEQQTAKLAIAEKYSAEYNCEVYPARLCPCDETEKRGKKDSYPYMCHYSIWSLIIMFLIFAFIGYV